MVDPKDCIFCKIISGEVPSKKIFDDDTAIAFLDINPANKGHCLVIPKKHSQNIYDIEDRDLEKLIIITKNLAKLLKDKLACNGVNIIQNNEKHAGQIVAHFHIHIIPRYENDKVVITYQRINLSEADLEDVKKKLTETSSNKETNWDFHI